MTTWSKLKTIAEELLCIVNDAKEIQNMVLGNERVKMEIGCLIDDVNEIIKLCTNNGNEYDGK